MLGCGPAGLIMILAACSSDTESSRGSVAATSTVTTETAPSTTAAAARTSQSVSSVAKPGVWRMPSEEDPHERTWMCWPSSTEIWDSGLADVQETIANLATAISTFEPVTLLARPDHVTALRSRLNGAIDILEAPVDDLWARDTLPNFLIRETQDGRRELGTSHATFNGWGSKQIHDGDTQLARLVADHLRNELIDSGLIGEGGGVEVDGGGNVLASKSCWVNANRNPGLSDQQVESALLAMLGASRVLWIDGLAGKDITDGHIDTLARFAGQRTIVIDRPAFDDSSDPWVVTAAKTKAQVAEFRTATGDPYRVVEVVQPTKVRRSGDQILSTYMNFYVCNNAVIAPEFGDEKADAAARQVLAKLFPSREIVLVNIDALAAGGGGIHCATQQQPATKLPVT